MSTFLQLVNIARQEAGVASNDLTTLQGTLSTETNRFKNWIGREWLRVQADKPDWQFMRRSSQFTLTASKYLYSPTEVGAAATPAFTAATFGNWKRDSFRIYSTDYTDEMLAGFMPWETFRNVYQYGSMRNSLSRPVAFSVAPDKSLAFGITPDLGYGVVFEYYTAPLALSADGDTPTMPAQFHDLIVYRALRAYGVFMAAPEVLQRADMEIARIHPKLLADQLPVFLSGPPLA